MAPHWICTLCNPRQQIDFDTFGAHMERTHPEIFAEFKAIGAGTEEMLTMTNDEIDQAYDQERRHLVYDVDSQLWHLCKH